MFSDDQSSNDVATDTAALLGSRGNKYGGASTLLYDQFELVSPVTKKQQIILLQVQDIAFFFEQLHYY